MLPEVLAKGGRAEALVAARALEKGMIPSKPMVDARYDLVLDDGEKRSRVQVKHCNSTHKDISGSVSVDLRRRGVPYHNGEIDALILYVERTGQFLWLPADMISGKTSISVRYAPSKNSQNRRCVQAEQYLW